MRPLVLVRLPPGLSRENFRCWPRVEAQGRRPEAQSGQLLYGFSGRGQANQSTIETVTSLVSPQAANIERAGFAVPGVVINPGDACGVDAFLFADQLNHDER